jgi:hypothetical protein
MHPTKNLKVVAAIAAVVIVMITLVSLISQSVLAQPANHGLRPPFNFQRTASPQTPSDIGLPFPGSTVIFTETFDNSFAPTTDLGTTSTEWRVMTNTGAADFYWGGVNTGGYEPSAWPAAAQIVPSVGVTYPANLDTWLIYGPLDLSKFASAYLSFDYYVDTTPGSCQPAYSGDCLTWAYSYDGQTFFGSQISGHLSPASGWLSGSLILDNKQFKTSPVYIAFAFKGGSSPSGDGAFIRNLALTGNPLKYVYLSLIYNNYTPPPAPPLFGYTFDDDGTDLAHWGGAYYGSGTNFKYGQCLPGQCTIHATTSHGNVGTSLRLYTNSYWYMVATSPNDITPSKYDLYVEISPWMLYPRNASCGFSCPPDDLGNWYGVIFNATSNTFGADPSTFNYYGPGKYYRVYFYNIDSVKPIGINLDRCDGSGHCTKLAGHSLPGSFIGNASAWDQMHITRDGTSIVVKINGVTVISANDGTYTSGGKYGVFIFPSDGNAVQNPPTGYEMQVDFDNIKVYSR